MKKSEKMRRLVAQLALAPQKPKKVKEEVAKKPAKKPIKEKIKKIIKKY